MPSRDLESLQALLGKAFRAGEPLADTPHATVVSDIVRPNARMHAVARAEIYREQFWLRHIDSLAEDLPALRLLLGEEAFTAFVRTYLLDRPPTSWTLRRLGDELVDFANGYDRFPEGLAEPARELVRFELTCFEAFDAADEEPADLGDLDSAPPERWASTRLSFLRTLSLATFAHPVNEARAAAKRGERVELSPRQTHVAVWRCPRSLEVKHRALPRGEQLLLAELLAGATIGEACLALPEPEPESIRRWFQGWSHRGWIRALEMPPT